MSIGIQSPYNPPMQPTSPQQAEYSRRVGRLERNYTELPDGNWIKKDDMERLAQQDKEAGTNYAQIAKEKGLDAVYKAIDADKKAFEASHTEIRSGEWMANDEWQNILDQDKEAGTSYAKIAQEQGIDAMNAQIKKDFEEFKGTHTQLGSGEWVPNDEWQKLIDADKANGTDFAKIAQEQGLDAANKAIEEWAGKQQEVSDEFKASHYEVRSGEWITNADWQKILQFDQDNGTNFADIAKKDGIDAMNAAIEKQGALDEKAQQEWMANHVQLGDGNWITKDAYNSIKAADIKNGTNYASIALKSGIAAMEAAADAKFAASNHKLNTGEWVSNTDWYEIVAYDQKNGTKYSTIAQTQGLAAMNSQMQSDYQKAQQEWSTFTATHIQLGDGKWITKQQWSQLSSMPLPDYRMSLDPSVSQVLNQYMLTPYDIRKENMTKGMMAIVISNMRSNPDAYSYQQIAAFLGYDALAAAISKDIAREEQTQQIPFTINDIITNPGITTDAKLILLKAIDQGLVIPREYTSPTAFDTPLSIQEVMLNPGITDEAKLVLNQALDAGIISYKMEVPVTISEIMASDAITPEAKEVLLSGISAGIVQAQTEYHKPRGALQSLWWGITPWKEETGETVGSYGLPKAIGVMTAEFVLPGFSTARHWNELDTYHKGTSIAMDALVFIPFAMAATKIGGKLVSRVANPLSKVAVPTAEGDIVVWRGLSITERPIIGKVAEGWRVGTPTEISLTAESIEQGFKPVTKLETRVLMKDGIPNIPGFVESEFIKTKVGTSELGKLNGWKVKPITTELSTAPTKTLSSEGVSVVYDTFADFAKTSKEPTMLYGSRITEQYLPKALRIRTAADIDGQLGTTASKAMEFTQSLADKLRKTEGYANVKIADDNPLLIMTRSSDGSWHHAVDIHTFDKNYLNNVEGAYGNMYKETNVVFKTPAGKKIEGMALAEAGKRKIGSSLEWRNGLFMPAEHRFPKDVIDAVIIMEAKGDSKAAKAFAEAYGLSYEEIIKLNKNEISKIAAKSAAETMEESPYIFLPQKNSPPVGLLPVSYSVSKTVSSSVGLGSPPSLNISDNIKSSGGSYTYTEGSKKYTINSQAYQYIKAISTPVSPGDVSKVLSSIPGSGGGSGSPSPSSPPSYSPPSIPDTSSPPGKSGNISIPGSPAPGSGKTSSVTKSSPPSPSPGSSMVSSSLSTANSKPIIPFLPDADTTKGIVEIPPGSITWKQGIFWKYIPPPWLQDKPITIKTAPVGAILKGRTPAQTIQMIGKPGAEVPESFVIDMGVTDIYVSDYGKKIKFKGRGLKTRASGVRSRTKGMRQGLSTSK